MGSDDLDFTKPPCRRSFPSGAFLGLAIIFLGVVFLLGQNGLLDPWRILRFWPLLLIGLGLWRLTSRQPAARVSGVILLVIGVLNSSWWTGFPMLHRFWPLLIVAIGVVLLWNTLDRRRGEEEDPIGSTSRFSEWTMFGGGERKISAPDFERGDALAIFGGWDIDLRRAGMKGTRAVIEANAAFGGVTLRVPEDWNVIVRGVGIFGGYTDSTHHPRIDELPVVRHLLVKGTAVFGGVDVRN